MRDLFASSNLICAILVWLATSEIMLAFYRSVCFLAVLVVIIMSSCLSSFLRRRHIIVVLSSHGAPLFLSFSSPSFRVFFVAAVTVSSFSDVFSLSFSISSLFLRLSFSFIDFSAMTWARVQIILQWGMGWMEDSHRVIIPRRIGSPGFTSSRPFSPIVNELFSAVFRSCPLHPSRKTLRRIWRKRGKKEGNEGADQQKRRKAGSRSPAVTILACLSFH